MNIRTSLSLLISLPLLLNACASQPFQNEDAVQKEEAIVDKDLVWKEKIERQLDSMSATMAIPADKSEVLTRLTATISVLEAENRRGSLDTQNQIDTINIQMATVKEELQSLQSKLRELKDKSEKQAQEKPEAKEVEPSKTEIKPEPIAVPDKQRQNERAKKAYYDAYFALKNGDYFEASLAFRNFSRDFPDSKLTNEATYWYGEALLAQGDATKAMQVFQEIIKKKSNSAKHAAAMLKAGFIYEEQKKMAEAISSYNSLIRRHPASPEAETARSRLKQKDRQG